MRLYVLILWDPCPILLCHTRRDAASASSESRRPISMHFVWESFNIHSRAHKHQRVQLFWGVSWSIIRTTFLHGHLVCGWTSPALELYLNYTNLKPGTIPINCALFVCTIRRSAFRICVGIYILVVSGKWALRVYP